MKLQRVTARDSGKLLIGLARREWIPTQKTDIWQLGGPASATIETPIDPDSSSAALTVRDSEVGPYQIIRRDQWKFSADLQQIVVPGGFPFPPVKSGTRLWGNFASQWQVMLALLLAMQDWLGESLPLLVPSVDADGNERAGIRLPHLAMPLGTYTGWNYQDPPSGKLQPLAGLIGSYFPFSRTPAERQLKNNPRISIDERYAGRDEYLARLAAAARELVSQRYLMERDVAWIVDAGAPVGLYDQQWLAGPGAIAPCLRRPCF